MVEFIEIVNTSEDVATKILIPTSRIRSIGESRKGLGCYIKTDTEDFWVDMTISQLAMLTNAISWVPEHPSV